MVILLITTLIFVTSVDSYAANEIKIKAVVKGGYYTVTFYDYNGTEITTTKYLYGDKIVIPSVSDTFEDTTYTYTFSGWEPDVSKICEEDAEYTAKYECKYREYIVTFVNHDDTVISSGVYKFGEPVTVPENPTRDSSLYRKYDFLEWNQPVVTHCIGDATYKAIYTSSIYASTPLIILTSVAAATTAIGFTYYLCPFVIGFIFIKKKIRLKGFYYTDKTKLINYVTSENKGLSHLEIEQVGSIQELASLLSKGVITTQEFFDRKKSSPITTVLPYKTRASFTVENPHMSNSEIHILPTLTESSVNNCLLFLLQDRIPGTRITLSFISATGKVYVEVVFT